MIIIHETGIYVIESKNYKGIIIGTTKDIYWTQKIGDNKYSFYSPLLQNLNHIRYLIKSLKILNNKDSIENFYSILIFGNESNIKAVRVKSQNLLICKLSNLRNNLIYNFKNNKKIFSNKEIDIIYNELKKYTNVSKKIQKKHIKDIKNINKKE